MGPTRRLTVAMVGDESLALQCALVARAAGDDVVAVATASAALRTDAEAAGLTVVEPSALADALAERPVDVLLSVANERVLPDEVLAGARHAVNFHDGPLPELAGLGVTTWAIHDGRTEHAVTWHRMTSDVDAGEILLEERFPIGADDSALSLNARCYEAGLATFPRLLDLLREDPAPRSGPGAPHRFVGRQERPLVWIDPAVPAVDLARRVRALDLGPRIRNRLGVARWWTGRGALVVGGARALESSGAAPGAVVSVDADGVRLATVEGDLLVTSLLHPHGEPATPEELAALGIVADITTVEAPPTSVRDALSAADPQLARHETHWIARLHRVDPDLPPHLATVGADGTRTFAEVVVPRDVPAEAIVLAVVHWWSGVNGGDATFALADAARGDVAPLLRDPVGAWDRRPDATIADERRRIRAELDDLRRRGGILADLVGREPTLRGRMPVPPLRLAVDVADEEEHAASPGVTVEVADGVLVLHVPGTLTPAWERVAGQLHALVRAVHDGAGRIADLPSLSADERDVLARLNDTARDHDRTATVDGAFRARVAATPDAPAVTCGDQTLTYAALAARVDHLAARLAEAGASTGSLVGIAVPRGIDLVTAVLAAMATGAAYVPLDPDYPEERLRFMVEDADLAVVVAERTTADRLGVEGRPVVDPTDGGVPRGPAPTSPHTADDVAYVIYTSGSTGRPKGVVLEHRNVTNFFAGMDDVIDHDPPGTWLAVTSLSFDISVLELLWTLTRGFHVVVQRQGIAAAAGAARRATARRVPTWSLFYFAAGHEQAAEGYRLLLESARFADAHGFEAVWLPERHFHDFGGAYPNPSVAAAAVAAVTERVHIRAGSVVLPLHASARVAEEWAFVDNLSHGRVGISFAPGWQPRDFVLNPASHGTARADLPRRIDEVRALWRGDALELPGPDGEPIAVSTLPRPVQSELPTWLTSAGTTATFEQAGRAGHNLLTHLLGQSIEQLATNVDVYRRAWREAGHPGDGHVTLMLHTHLDPDGAAARARAEGPMRAYLSSATGLIKNMASAFPTFANAGADADEAFRSLSPEEMDQLLTMATERYMETSGMFGTPEDAAALAVAVAEAGADEVACLIDFGVATDDVLGSLAHIDAARRLVLAGAVGPAEADDDESVAALVARHDVTHLQCTPSLAEILLADPDDRAALGRVRHLMVGGEALSEKVADELRRTVPGRLTNMYGPTETTIWSLVHEVEGPSDGAVPIGRPIANTTVHVLDPDGTPLPLGALGELHIGGEGVARGYLGRPELTAERFVDRGGLGRTYATGDLASIDGDGVVRFAGRADFQVKIRGHRIELGEIEAVLDAHPAVDRAIVVIRGEGADARLVAFVKPAAGQEADVPALLAEARRSLPAIMVPDAVGVVDDMPLTPNGKIDRAALPDAPADLDAPLAPEDVPVDDMEALVAEAWSSRLHRPVGRSVNVFDLGGNSLLAVAVFRHLQEATRLPLVLTDLFRHPTVAALGAHLHGLASGGAAVDDAAPATPTGADRGARRRQARAGRRGGG
ncbi:MupA/Atu3671 family FMN-dependent luciferase-like monooxygenase [Actinomarinicola tropica]|uniref:LLM class flavin-dependent oxidoreductase n=1 Tax=Actinomarinicola tropica TaxID=2789776 RepID=A0A5Q2RQ11_9ACTN|nr:MupA/Atu3671 family FMN-dependent luciferase-like monooxygenase [Actinomarinicola tropica]QGG95980.1 LLM class flavin-dependent oxidoreductase [Actinomarinicola tropica]